MSQATRRRIGISWFRGNIHELMRLGQKVPLVTIERALSLAPLIEARERCTNKPSWTAMFIKAFSIVATRHPHLRRVYMSYPYPHYYEHPCNHATIVVERDYEGEMISLQCRLRKPDQRSLVDLQQAIDLLRTGPLTENPTFKFMRLIGRMPLPIRRLIWNVGYHWSGSRRARYFGTFALSTTAAHGAGIETILAPLTAIHYGLFEPDGRIEMRVTIDHRPLDGSPIARALVEMEKVLLTEILAEVQARPSLRLVA